MECVNKSKNLKNCACTYSPCSRKGICCECIRYHLASGEVPACFFTPEAEKAYNRSKEYYFSTQKNK